MSTAEKCFVDDLRRSLYLMQIMKYTLTDFKQSSVMPTFMKVDCNNMLNSIARFFADCRDKNPKTWDLVQQDLSREQLHDISLLLDFASNISNVGTLVEVLNEHLKEQTA